MESFGEGQFGTCERGLGIQEFNLCRRPGFVGGLSEPERLFALQQGVTLRLQQPALTP